MERKHASEFPQEVLNLFDGYVHGHLSRREFLDRAAKYAVGGFTAAAMFESLRPNYAWAEQVPKKDPRIRTEYLTYPSPQGSGTMKGYYARPAIINSKLPGVVVIHENRGLNPYIEDVARRLAVANFLAFAPDALTPLGGYPGDDEKGGALFQQLDATKRTEDLLAAYGVLKARPECSGKVGVVGFCFGGGMANTLSVELGGDLAAAAPFYGGPPKSEDVAKIKAAILIHHGALDKRLAEGYPAQEADLKKNNIKYEGHIYPNSVHGFFNDATPERYDETSAKQAWTRTIEWFNQYSRA